MIAFSREVLETRGQSPHHTLIVGPQILLRQTTGTQETSDAGAAISKLVAADAARQQQELAILQRALVRCGLVGTNKTNNEE